jgi:hypothetical protein
MQNEKQIPESQTQSDEPSTGPFEIDASLLHLVSGGAPKNTWNELE